MGFCCGFRIESGVEQERCRPVVAPGNAEKSRSHLSGHPKRRNRCGVSILRARFHTCNLPSQLRPKRRAALRAATVNKRIEAFGSDRRTNRRSELRTFVIYYHDSAPPEAVKRGFSWPAFFLAGSGYSPRDCGRSRLFSSSPRSSREPSPRSRTTRARRQQRFWCCPPLLLWRLCSSRDD